MTRVLDLTTDDAGAAVLHRTEGSGGLFGTDHRSDRPLASYLAEGETARYLLRNKGAGVTIDGPDGERTVSAGEDYQAFAVVTDRRICFVAGDEGGDRTVSLPLADVLEADAESAGLLSARLVVGTPDGRRFRFPCRGDLDAMVETLRDDGSAWAHAERLLEEADAAVEDARRRLSGDDHEAAIASMDEADAIWAEALDGLAAVHEAAVEGLAERIAVRREMSEGLRRQVVADAGASAHASAQAAWRRSDYERAAAAYERAIAAYEEAIGLSGRRPDDDGLGRRIAGAAAERAILRAAPVADAAAAAGRAEAADDPAEAAEAWEVTHERYRHSLELEWGASGRRFEVDREAVREDAAGAAERAIDARLEAGRRWLAAGDKLATAEDVESAHPVYDRAGAHLESALHLAREVLPDRVGDVEDRQTTLDGRLDGSIDPASSPEEAPLPVESVAEALAVVEADAEADSEAHGDGDADESEVPEETPITAVGPAGETEADVSPGAGGDEAATEPEASPDDVLAAVDAAESAPGSGDGGDPSGGGTDATTDADPTEVPPVGLGDDEGRLAAEEGFDRERLVATLGSLSPGDLAELVAEVWSARGWSTTVFTSSGSTVYDVLGIAGTDARLLLWADERPDGAGVPPAVVERIATTRDRSRGGDRAVLVTTGSVPEATSDRAGELGVDVVDVDGMCDLLVATGLLDRVLDETSS